MIDPARLHAAQSRIRECIDRGLPPSPADLQICLASQDAPTLDTLLMAALDQAGQLQAENAVLRTALETVLAEAGTRLRPYHPTLVERIEEVLRTAQT
jgi:hypothetical protein